MQMCEPSSVTGLLRTAEVRANRLLSKQVDYWYKMFTCKTSKSNRPLLLGMHLGATIYEIPEPKRALLRGGIELL